MNHNGNLLCQTLLKRTGTRILLVFLNKSINLLLGKRSEYLDIFLRIRVGNIEPELIELIGGGVFRIEPNVAALGLSKLAAVGLGDKRAGECEHLAAILTTDKFGTGCDISPLIRTAKLKLAILGLI